MRIASFIPLAFALGAALIAVWIVFLIGQAYDSEMRSQLRCLPDDPNACVVTP